MSEDKNRLRKLFAVNPMHKVGEGARSKCWAVFDPKTHEVRLLKYVAVENAKDGRWVEQLESEHEIASRFKHPNIRSSNGLVYQPSKRKATDVGLIMQFVDGSDLVEWQQATKPDLIRLLDIFIACADALNHMHIVGYAHADMKPINVLVDNRSGEPYIIDLGQACPLNTQKERVQGTPGFIAPEQVKRQAVTYLTDVFNWGATMYFMLSGRKIDTEGFSEPTALSGCPASLSDLVLECVRPDPMTRPDSMKYVRNSLSRIRDELLQQEPAADGVDSESMKRSSG